MISNSLAEKIRLREALSAVCSKLWHVEQHYLYLKDYRDEELAMLDLSPSGAYYQSLQEDVDDAADYLSELTLEKEAIEKKLNSMLSWLPTIGDLIKAKYSL
jgi:hypothetical protein